MISLPAKIIYLDPEKTKRYTRAQWYSMYDRGNDYKMAMGAPIGVVTEGDWIVYLGDVCSLSFYERNRVIVKWRRNAGR